MDTRICVVGLGYVGLTLATALAEVGLRVVGVERRGDVVEMASRGVPHFSEVGLADALGRVVAEGRLVATEDVADAEGATVFVITVGTPLDADGLARTDFVSSATREVASVMGDDALVVLRSTVRVGTARDVVAPILTASGRRFALAMCPERTLEGNAMEELRRIPQVVGADDETTRQRASALFHQLTQTVHRVSSLEAAELIKLVDNAYRDVRFGFANEVARVCDAWGVNAMEVIEGGRLGYPRTDVAVPGPVGGPCLEKDPHILRQSAQDRGLQLGIVSAARAQNEDQPREIVRAVLDEHRRRRSTPPVVAVLGVAFKGVPETDDLRGSTSLRILAELRRASPAAEIRVHDPVCTPERLRGSVGEDVVVHDGPGPAIAGADVALIANNHPALGRTKPRDMVGGMRDTGFVFDCWNHFSHLAPEELSGVYFAVGNLVAGRGAT